MIEDRIVVPKLLRYADLSALQFGQPESINMCGDAAVFWWPNMRQDIERKSKTCSACLNASKNLKFQIPQTEKSKIESPKTPGEEIQIDFTGNLHNKKLSTNPPVLIAVDKNSRSPVAKTCKNLQKYKPRNRNFIFERKHINDKCIRSTETNKIG